MKLALVMTALAIVAGAFFYGVSVGKTKAENNHKQEIINAGKRDVDVEVRQSKIRANRDNYNLSERLLEGSF